MASTSILPVKDGNPFAAVQEFLGSLLEQEIVDAIFTPCEQGGAIMPALISKPDRLSAANPLAPCFPLNVARQISRLTHGEGTGRIAALMRPCEIRAFIELVKLNQGSLERLLVIGLDCLGAFDNRTYAQAVQNKNHNQLTLDFFAGKTEFQVAKACQACEFPEPVGADLVLGLAGQDIAANLLLISQTAKGEGVLSRLELADSGLNDKRESELNNLRKQRSEFRDAMFVQLKEQTDNLQKLSDYLAGCVNCYNCRVACPVCYCKECVFATDVFDHKPWQLMNWADKNGAIKMPTDTVFYHLTRLSHMSLSCVGCGQCSNACPNDIGVMELFRMVADRTQAAFSYQAGRDVAEPLPLSVFQEEEFSEMTGPGH